MSNASYRRQLAELEALRARQVREAEALLEKVQMESDARADQVEHLFHEQYKFLGGVAVSLEIQTAESLMKAGELCRKYDLENTAYNLKLIQSGREPQKFPPAAVSASVHLGAIRTHQRALERENEIKEDAKVKAASALGRLDKKKRIDLEKEARKFAPDEAAQAPASVPDAEPESAATPDSAATSQVA